MRFSALFMPGILLKTTACFFPLTPKETKVQPYAALFHFFTSHINSAMGTVVHNCPDPNASLFLFPSFFLFFFLSFLLSFHLPIPLQIQIVIRARCFWRQWLQPSSPYTVWVEEWRRPVTSCFLWAHPLCGWNSHWCSWRPQTSFSP